LGTSGRQIMRGPTNRRATLSRRYQQYPQDAPLPCAEPMALTDVNAHLPNLSQRQPQPRGEYSVLPHRTLTE